MKIIKVKSKDHSQVVREATRTLKQGGLIIYPSDTSYGIGVLPSKQEAVDKLFRLKKGRQKAVSLLFTPTFLLDYILLNDYSTFMLDYFLPGRYTLISQLKNNVNQKIDKRLLPLDKNTLGWRIITQPLLKRILTQVKEPITATSANLPGLPPSYSVKDFLDQLNSEDKKNINLILDAGPLPHQAPSAVLDTSIPTTIFRSNKEIILPLANQIFPNQTEDHLDHLATNFLDFINQNSQSSPNFKLILLFGHLGAGKTTFIRTLLKRLDYTSKITSPSFTLINEYPLNSSKIIHLDLWRLNSTAEIETLDIHRYFQNRNTILVEWGEKYLPLLEKNKHQLLKNTFGVAINSGEEGQTRNYLFLKLL